MTLATAPFALVNVYCSISVPSGNLPNELLSALSCFADSSPSARNLLGTTIIARNASTATHRYSTVPIIFLSSSTNLERLLRFKNDCSADVSLYAVEALKLCGHRSAGIFENFFRRRERLDARSVIFSHQNDAKCVRSRHPRKFTLALANRKR